MYRQSLERCQSALGKEHSGSLDSEWQLADVLAKQKRWEDAEAISRRVLETDKMIFRERA